MLQQMSHSGVKFLKYSSSFSWLLHSLSKNSPAAASNDASQLLVSPFTAPRKYFPNSVTSADDSGSCMSGNGNPGTVSASGAFIFVLHPRRRNNTLNAPASHRIN